MPATGLWLSRQNEALKLRGLAVSLELAGSRIRLRASMPPKPADPPGSPWRQQRISTGLEYPTRASEAVELAETLGRSLERSRLGFETFDWAPWDLMGRQRRQVDASGRSVDAISGSAALSLTRKWWEPRGRRGRSADDSWEVDFRQPLSPLRDIQDLQPSHLVALVDACVPSSRTRLRAGRAAASMAQAIGWSPELVTELRQRGKGYSARQASPRSLPTEREIEALIDELPPVWQWPVGVVATYGCRPHEALLHAEVLPSGLVRIADGKTGARQSLAMPAEWLKRWQLSDKRLPPTMKEERGHRAAGMAMGHSLAVHSSVYQRWFDAHEMESLQAELSAVS